MSEETTQNLQGSASFEARIFARLDSIDVGLASVDARFDSVDARLDSVDARFDSVHARLDSVDARFDAVNSRFDSVDARLQSLEDQAERRAYETKPIWERALAEIIEVKERLGSLEQLSNQIVRKIDVLGRDMLTLRADQAGVEERLDKLESNVLS